MATGVGLNHPEVDSGIDLDLMSFITAEEDPVVQDQNYYKIRQTIIVGSPATEIKNASLPMRANLKQQLQRQQLLEQEKRDQQDVSRSQSHTQAVLSHHITGSNSITVPRIVETAEVPVNVLKVTSHLQNPTKYHVRQSQKRQVENFLNDPSDKKGLPHQSLPANLVSIQPTEQTHYHHIQSSNSHSAPGPDLPGPLMGPGADFVQSDLDLDILQDLQSLQGGEDLGSLLVGSDLVEIEPSLGASSNGSLLTGFDAIDSDSSQPGNFSCPTPVFSHQDLDQNAILSVQDEMWRKERIKKDNHNMIERRRRFNINDRIKELGGLLPRHFDPESRQNKGNILKASVDYIKSLQDDQRRLAAVTEQKKKTESDLRKVLITLNQMTSVLQSHGVQVPSLDTSELQTVKRLSTMDFLSPAAVSPAMSPVTMTTAAALSSPASPSSTQTAFSPAAQAEYSPMANIEDLMMDTSVHGDPMLLSAPVSPGDAEEFGHFS